MRYLTKTLDFDSRGDSVVTLGKFDGLHRGHMLLIRRVLAIGRTERLETVVFTFDVPPQSKVQHVKPHQLLTNEERRARLEQLGMDCLVECPFVDEVMHMTPEAFIKEILVDKLHAKKVVVGKDFGFGYKRSGTAEMLKEMGPSLGFETEIIEKAEENGRRDQQHLGTGRPGTGQYGSRERSARLRLRGSRRDCPRSCTRQNDRRADHQSDPTGRKAASAVRRLRFRGENRRKNLLRYHKHRC